MRSSYPPRDLRTALAVTGPELTRADKMAQSMRERMDDGESDKAFRSAGSSDPAI